MKTNLSIIGQVFGRLTVIAASVVDRDQKRQWLCQCTCGNQTLANKFDLVHGKKMSCGCLMRETSSEKMKKHRMPPVTHGLLRNRTRPREYSIWAGAKNRCFNSKCGDYSNYGGRGITMCDKWKNDFVEFLNDMGPAPAKHSLDRIDNDKGYEPGNCRWANQQTQSGNMRRNHIITANGITKNLCDWAEELGVSSAYIRQIIKSGKTLEDYIMKKK